MSDDFFAGFAARAHTMNELETDPQKESELRRKNSPEEAQKLIGMTLYKLEKDLSTGGYGLDDVKLSMLYLSYRGEPADRDTAVCETVLNAIENRFRKHTANQLRLVGHTTAGELENEDLVLKQITGIGYNGLSILALVTNLPIGVGRTWGLRTLLPRLHRRGITLHSKTAATEPKEKKKETEIGIKDWLRGTQALISICFVCNRSVFFF